MHLSQRPICQAAYGFSDNPAGVVTTTVMDVALDGKGRMTVQKVREITTIDGADVDTQAPTNKRQRQDEDDGSYYNNNVDANSEAESVEHAAVPVDPVLQNPSVTLISDDDKQPYVFTAAREHEVKLLKILNDINAPLYSFELIMQWAFDANVGGYDFDPAAKHHNTQIANLQKMTNLGSIRPKIAIVKLSDGMEMPVVKCHFPSMVLSLLNDLELNQLENLVINPLDPFGKYVPPDGRLDEVNSGAMYQMAYHTLCLDPSKDFLLMIILTMDKTTVSANSDLDSFPLMFTLAIFNSSVRSKICF